MKVKNPTGLIATLIIIIWMLIPTILSLFHLEFNNDKLEEFYQISRLVGVPILLAIVIVSGINREDEQYKKVLIAIAAVAISIFAFIFMTLSLFTSMCTWTDHKVLYTNVEDPNVKIIKREFGCGATDSSAPHFQDFQIQEYTKYFIKATEVNIEEIDLSKWHEN